MNSGVRVLCGPASAPGFGLAGLAADIAEEADQAEALLRGYLARPDLGVVLVDETLLAQLAPEARALMDRVAQPVVVPIPGPAWRAAPTAEEQVVELLRRAIGYRVRLR